MAPLTWQDFEKIGNSSNFRPQNPRFGAKSCPGKSSKSSKTIKNHEKKLKLKIVGLIMHIDIFVQLD